MKEKNLWGCSSALSGGWDNADFEAGVLCGSPAAECKDPEPAVWQLPHAAAPQTLWEDRRSVSLGSIKHLLYIKQMWGENSLFFVIYFKTFSGLQPSKTKLELQRHLASLDNQEQASVFENTMVRCLFCLFCLCTWRTRCEFPIVVVDFIRSGKRRGDEWPWVFLYY